MARWLRWLPRSLASEVGYSLLRPPKRRGRVAPTPATIEAILRRLANDGITVREVRITPAEYHDYVERAGYRTRFSSYYPNNRAEKALEHFLAQRLLNLTSADVYVDVASERSPVPEIYQRLFGCRTYAQDLSYPGGINDGLIGGDAAAMPVPDGFATALGLHCSFEHFEDDSDRRFVYECARVLRPGGAAVVVPLYLNDDYAIQTDPIVAVTGDVRFERDAVICATPRWGNRHGRFYDAAHLRERLMVGMPALLAFEVVSILNVTEIGPSCYANVALIIRRA